MNDHVLARRRAIPSPWLVWLPRLLLALVLVGAVAGLAVALARPEEVPRRAVDLDDASAWLVSSTVGQAVLVDGTSGQIVTRVDIGGHGSVGTQEGTDAFVSSTDGTVLRIDGTTYRVNLPTSPFSGRGEPLTLFPAPAALFAVSQARGVVFVVDPRTLRVRATVAVHATIRDGAVLADGSNRLWIVDAATGDLLRVDGDGRQSRAGTVDPAWTRLISVSGRPVAVDLAAGQARPIEADGVTGPGVCVDAAKDGSVVVAGAGPAPPPGQLRAEAARWIFVASQRSGLLFLSDLATGTCDDVIDLDVAGHRLGQPVEAAGLVFVPDLTTSRVIVVDLAGRKVKATANVPVAPDKPFELQRAGSVVFFNDPAGSTAGVIQPSGTVTTVEKYGPESTGADDEPADAPPPPPTPTSSTPPPSPTEPATTPPATARPTPPKVPPASPPAATPSPPPVVPPVPPPAAPAPRQTSPEAPRPPRTTSAAPTATPSPSAPVVAPPPIPTPTGAPPTSAPPVAVPSPAATVPPPANGPTARLNVSQASGIAPLPVRLDASGSSAAGPAVPIVSYNFMAGPGGSVTQTTGNQASAVVDLTFDTPGTWLVTVRVTDAAGNSAQSTPIQVTVRAPQTTQPPPVPSTTPPPPPPTTTSPPPPPPPTTTSPPAPPRTTSPPPPTTTSPPPPRTTTPAPPPPTTAKPPSTFTEVTGNTGSPTFATVHFVGPNTPRIGVNVAVQVRCRTTGDAVEDGNTWFYLVTTGVAAGRYAPADNFYNDGSTSGGHNNVFVDTKVPLC
ncbi:PKD domain-containing protein [Pseudofrankia asymbiotica]|uniref:PKD domain-containing protein n=1 Tax=Pseudofrankia asymbiotica TaxID=1834516 RepID=A0A1V2I8R3_9ACTN|nr:PKD domain-containing protein [Pseudofrankia asymbiotica]ONH28803.1 hypothetical protein BL253_18350 [Pseudofrankia asymbiotica]